MKRAPARGPSRTTGRRRKFTPAAGPAPAPADAPAQPPPAMPMRPWRRAFYVLFIAFAAWMVLLLAMYFLTVYPSR